MMKESTLRNVYALTKLSKPPILIGGCGRSGTSLLQSILSAHPSVFGVSIETDIFIQPRKFQSDKLNRWNNLRKIYGHLLVESNVRNSFNRWCEKTPRNVRFFDVIYQEFDKNVRLINVVRDGRSVITSIFPETGQYHVPLERWISDVEIGIEMSRKVQLLTVRYEDLILKFEETMKIVCEFIDEPLVPEVLNFHKYSSIQKHGAWHGGQLKPIFADSLKAWDAPNHKERVELLMSNSDAVRLLNYYSYL